MSAAVQPKLERDADIRADLAQAREQLKACMVDLQNAETELRGMRREVKRLKTELDKARGQHVGQADANAVFDYWCGKLSKRKGTKFGEKRQRVVKARLRENFTVDELRLAIDGCARFPFVTGQGRRAEGKPSERYDDLELICRDETTVERFMALAERDEPARPSSPAVSVQRERVQPRSALELADQLERTHGLTVRHAPGYGATRFSSQCPAHEDRSPSLSITELGDGRILLYCFAGCETEEILRAVGWEWGHVMGGDPARTSGAVDARYQERLR